MWYHQWKCHGSGIVYTERVQCKQTTNSWSINHGLTNIIAIVAMVNAILAIGIPYLVI